MGAILLALILLCAAIQPAAGALGDTTRISVSSAVVEGDDRSGSPAISGDGRYVAFDSLATNLVTGDTNNNNDVFVHDRQTGVTTRVSVSSSGVEGDNDSYDPAISADGRFVAFWSFATNLVSGDSNGRADVFIHDRQTGVTSRVSVSSTAVEGDSDSYDPSISADGRYVAFESLAANLVTGDTNGLFDVFVHDRQAGQTTRISVSTTGVEGNSVSMNPAISGDGRYVAFWSIASNLVTGDNNSHSDAFVHDRQTGQTSRVSVSSAGVEGDSDSYDPAISGDGRYVAFYGAQPTW